MAFTVEDFQDLLRLLEQRPEWRAELRRQVLTGELLELPAIVGDLATHMDQLTAHMDQLAARMDQLVDQLAALADHVGKLNDRVGTIEGEMLELRYERRAAAYFGPLARKLRLVDRSQLADMLDEALDAGRLAPSERDAVLAADLVLSGQRREDRAEAYFVVEVSVGVGLDDVSRAAERAATLAKLGRPAVPVVAGRWINEQAEAAAQDRGVRQILDGRPTSPGQT